MSNYERSEANAQTQSKQQYVDIKMGKHDIFFKKNYNNLYLINDFLLGWWFLIGSILFYFKSLQHWGVTLFVLGSLQMLIRPTIRLVHRFHMRRIYKHQYEEQN